MRASFLLIVAWIVISVNGFADPGAYERLWYWYAYHLDTNGKLVAPTCAKPGQRCSFRQFVEWINLGDKLEPSHLNNVDTDNVEEAFGKLKAAHATGAYNCQHLLESSGKNSKLGRNDCAKVMNKVNQLIKAKIETGAVSDLMKSNLQIVTRAVAIGRTSASLAALTEWLQDRKGYTVVPRQIPLYRGSTDMVDFIDPAATAATKPGTTEDDLINLMIQEQEDDPGHTNNKNEARQAASDMSKACVDS